MGVLAGIEPRFRTFVLIGATASEAEHIRTSNSPYWNVMKQRMTPEEFARTLEKIAQTDPAVFLPSATAPVLVQCANLDTPDNVEGCKVVHKLTGGPKRIVWYDDDHRFTSWEAGRDRLAWLARHLNIRGVDSSIRTFMRTERSGGRDTVVDK